MTEDDDDELMLSLFILSDSNLFCLIGKIADIFPKKNLLKNVPCVNIQNYLDGCCVRTHFKLLQPNSNMLRLIDYGFVHSEQVSVIKCVMS